MTRIPGLGLAVLLSVMYPGSARAIVRINGNQLAEALGEFGESTRARGTAQTTGPARIVFSLGQGVMARGGLPDSAGAPGDNVAVVIGIGLGYDIANVVYDFYCPIRLTGDVNLDGVISGLDIVYLVNHIFKGGAGPLPDPCAASGDVNCSGELTASDITYLVTFVYLGGPPPCDVCTLIPSVWPCTEGP